MCIFSVGKLFCTCGAGDDASYVRFGETKDKFFNRSLRHGTEMRHRNLRSDSVHTGSIGTGAVLVPGFGTQPYLRGALIFKNVIQALNKCLKS